ncbi:hypothetical protein AMECASPLE_033455 [Ameca splendens]|uniref:Uncharacterized protein n=1 Tax=Ameca splendens TaxID=208324 RepID=A0ABV0ZSR6_9TELE
MLPQDHANLRERYARRRAQTLSAWHAIYSGVPGINIVLYSEVAERCCSKEESPAVNLRKAIVAPTYPQTVACSSATGFGKSNHLYPCCLHECQRCAQLWSALKRVAT